MYTASPDRSTSEAIARRLFIEPATVQNHVPTILEQLRVHRRADAAARLREAVALMSPVHLDERSPR